ncbi:uncharacterized protein BX663DRAFT_502848 [Cokeromyces recurvatus]|uniref:uncharacterized protein n=1 Tax=Cokeromyces recurvatus TaxID=90255 RepID=UPI0022205B87|nr:uncharacterized protein BX663DRAFT_502848 [Cokeromyces recurvatus]KAI7904576.1 hypothetical protein BX663DRAFT_502848 [Cokeromyces recurvatus]
MSNIKELKSKLQNNGYCHQWKLLKTKEIETKRNEFNDQYVEFDDKIIRQTTKPLCQNIDLIVPSKNRTPSQKLQLKHFFNIIGTELHEQESCFMKLDDHHLHQIENTDSDLREFERNDEKRQFRIQEFIKTEQSYVDTLKTVVKYVVNPLRINMHQKNSILNTFKCQKIFLNIDQIMQVNRDFLSDLLTMKKSSNFGDLCKKHINKFECYRKYLLEQAEAQKLHANEYKTNQNYKRFISKVKEVPEFKRKRLQDILVEPVQRISRYSMMLRDILQLTPEEHPEFRGLKAACEKASEIATMADDNETKIVYKLLNLHHSIKDCPCSLISQKRSIIAHLDAIEIHRVTNKPTRAVSIFLFTDKILVASRSSLDAKEINLEHILNNNNNTHVISPTHSSSTSLLFSSNHHPYKMDKHLMKFKGWADIESIELFEGVPERPGSFILSTTSAQELARDEVSNITTHEKYFYKGPRLFTVIPTRDEYSMSKSKRTDYIERMMKFREEFQKTRALMKRYDTEDKAYYRTWNGVPIYCNIYSQESYTKARYKNDCTIVYMENDLIIEPEDLFSTRSSLYNPWIVGLIQPEEMKGFRFNICTRTPFPTSIGNKSNEQTIDFESIFWNNLIYLNQCLKRSQDYVTQSILKIQQAANHSIINRRSSHRSKSKSLSRTSSIPTIGKLFHTNNDRSRSVSPSKMLVKTSRSSQSIISPKCVPVHYSWSGSSSCTSSSQNDTYRHHSPSVTTLASSFWSTASSYQLSHMNATEEQSNITTDKVYTIYRQE